MSYLTLTEYNRVYTLPISLPETELRRRCFIQVSTFRVTQGTVLELACLHLQVLRILTPGMSPMLADSSLGLAGVGFLASSMLSSAVGLVTQSTIGTRSLNADQPVVVTAPGVYRAVVFNNSSNVDLAVVVSGAVRVRDVGQPAQADMSFTPITSIDVATTSAAFSSLLGPANPPPVIPPPPVAIGAPVITAQLSNQMVQSSILPSWIETARVMVGALVPLTVGAVGAAPLTYQWQVNYTTRWVNLPGATSSTYTATVGKAYARPAVSLPLLRYLTSTWFRCVVTNSLGSVTSAAVQIVAV